MDSEGSDHGTGTDEDRHRYKGDDDRDEDDEQSKIIAEHTDGEMSDDQARAEDEEHKYFFSLI